MKLESGEMKLGELKWEGWGRGGGVRGLGSAELWLGDGVRRVGVEEVGVGRVGVGGVEVSEVGARRIGVGGG